MVGRPEISVRDDGTYIYAIDAMPETLPAVRGRDIEQAWAQAREAAHRAAWSQRRAFQFRRADGGVTELLLEDADARCWAGAVDRAVGLQSLYGLSVCLRLLALVDLLARAPWLSGQFVLDRGAVTIPATILRLAAEASLTDDAGFDDMVFRNRLVLGPAGARGNM